GREGGRERDREREKERKRERERVREKGEGERERERGCLAGCMGILFNIWLSCDRRNTRRVLYPGSSALLHGTTYAVCSPVMLIRGVLHVFSYAGWPARQVKVFFKQLFM